MVDIVRFGATPADWAHFDLVLELTADLLPVVSNPNCEISEFSKVKEPGKTPSDYNRHGKMRGLSEWTSLVTGRKEIAKWETERDYGICVQTRVVRAIDVDIDDFDESEDVFAFIENHLSVKLPARRRSNSSKFLLAFRMPGDFAKRRFKTQKGVIEFLANGQQFVAVGTHPSGVRYAWEGGLPNTIPELDEAEFEALWSALNEKFGTEDSIEKRQGMTPTKRRQIADINDRVVDFLDDRGWIRDVARDGRVDVTCPWEDQHTSDTGDSSTSYYPAGVGGFERGHFVCMHAHCAHRTDQDFLNEIGWSLHGFEEIEIDEPVTIDQHGNTVAAPPAVPSELTSDKHRNKDGTIKPNRTTLAVAVAYPSVCGCSIGYDQFRDEIMRGDSDGLRPLRDDDYYDIALSLEQGSFGFTHIPSELIRDSVRYVAQRKTFDSLQDWLSALPKWDGKTRVETFLRDFMGAEDTPYTRAISRYFWSALAGRGMNPGIKADMVPIAVGKQGARKTSLVAAIAPTPDMFLELDLSKSDDDLAREMRGKIIAELGELKGMGAKQVEHIKSFLSRRFEEWVPKFKEFSTRYPRRCMAFGTTNEDEPLPEDDTGHRRWLPFRVDEGHKCSVEDLIAVREQLWAEAVKLFGEHGVMWQDAERLAPAIHKEFEKEDSWVSRIEQWIFNAEMGDIAPIDAEGGLRLIDVLEHALNLRMKEINVGIERRVGKCLKQIGLKKTVRNGKKIWIRGSAKSH